MGTPTRQTIFEGRGAELARFRETINLVEPGAPTDPRILYFHGPQGIGKSTLMRHLRDSVCPTLYGQARAASKDRRRWSERSARQAPNRIDATQIAFAHLDFDHDGNSIECSKIGAVGLYAVARHLAKFSVVCPLFTVACFAHFKTWGRASDKRDFALLRTEELKAINAAWEASSAESVPGAKLAIALLDLLKRHSSWLIDKATQDELAERVKVLGAMDPARELALALPDLLAEDLNRAMRHELGPARIVLLFDTHDAFWHDGDSPQSAAHFHLQDAWLQRLLKGLDRGGGITAVVAGRTRPRWDAGVGAKIPAADVLLSELPGLSESEAHAALKARGCKDAQRKLIVEQTMQVSNLPGPSAHPATLEWLALGEALSLLPVDHLEWLVGRVSDAETRDALVALSALEAFGDEAYFLAGDLLRFAATRARLRELVRDEWLEHAGGAAAPSYRLAKRVQQILRKASIALPPERPNLWRDAQQALADHFDKQGNPARAAIHRSQLDPDRAVRDAAAYLRGDRE